VLDVAALGRRELRPLRRQMQMIFQDPFSSLNPRRTLLDIVAEPLVANGIGTRRERLDRVVELLRLVGLRPEYMRRYPHAFSGGQRQRVGIARRSPSAPASSCRRARLCLDVSVQAQILNLLQDLQDKLGLTYLFVAHDLRGQARERPRGRDVRGAHRGAGAHGGALRHARHPYTEALLAAVPKPDPRLRAKRILLEGEVADPSNPPPGCHFHPRCAYAVERCRVETPVLTEIVPGHAVACHRAPELTCEVSRPRGQVSQSNMFRPSALQ